jgi:putative DNA primase/helicase
MAQLRAKGRSVASRSRKSRKPSAKAPAIKLDVAKQQEPQRTKSLPQKFAKTDLGNARRLVALHGADLRYCKPWKSWLIWDGKRWTVDRTGEIDRRAKSTVDGMKLEAKGMDEEDARKEKLFRHCTRSQNAARLAGMCRVAESESQVVITPEELDKDPFLFNCKNGTLDLKNGTLRQFRRSDMLTKLSPVEFSESATCPKFEEFLKQITNGDVDLMSYLQRIFGYCMTGSVKEKALFIFVGDGNNGKTTLLEAFRHVLGDYAGQIPIESLLKSNDSKIPNDVAQLNQKRFVTSSEPSSGRAFNSALMKYITGMGTLQARELYKEFFEFAPTFKLFIDANLKPRVPGDDMAVWNRIYVVPFGVTIRKEEMDKDLMAKLKDEAPGIFNWALQGCLDWQKNGLQEPEAVRKASAAYREEMDTVARFITECCELGTGCEARTAELYFAYSEWCEQEGGQAEARATFGRLLGQRMDLQQMKIDGDRGWNGIRLKDNDSKGDNDRPRHALMG